MIDCQSKQSNLLSDQEKSQNSSFHIPSYHLYKSQRPKARDVHKVPTKIARNSL